MFNDTATFVAGASEDGEVVLYDADDTEEVVCTLPAVYANNQYTVTGIPFGKYSKIEFTVSNGEESRQTLVAENAVYDETGFASYSSELNATFIDDDYDVDEEKLEYAVRSALKSIISRKPDNQGIFDAYAEGHKIWDYEVKDFSIYVYLTAELDAFSQKVDGQYTSVYDEKGPYMLIFDVDKEGEYRLEKVLSSYETPDWETQFPENLIQDLKSEDYSSDFYQDQIKKYL